MLSPIHPGALLALLAAVSPLPTAMAKQMTIVNSCVTLSPTRLMLDP